MKIVIQDKSMIVNLENIEAIFVDDKKNEVTAKTTGDIGISLGKYETRARALEVLKLITNSYKQTQFYKYGTTHDKGYIIETLDSLFVYEMPAK